MNKIRLILSALICALLIFIITYTTYLNIDHQAEGATPEVNGIVSNALGDLPDYDPTLYSIENPYIANDIYDFNSLSSYIAFPIDQDANFSYTVEGKDQYTDFTYTDDTFQTENLVIPVIGLYANYDNTIDITVNYSDGTSATTTVTITTGELKSYISETIEVDYTDQVAASASLEGGLIFDNRINGYDLNGDIRVALEIENLDWQGNALRINDDGSFMMGTQDYIYNMSLTGKIFHEYKAPDGYYMNHDYLQATNGYTYAIVTPDDENLTYTTAGYQQDSFIAVYQTDVDEYPSQIFDINKLVLDNAINVINTAATAQGELLHLNSLTYDAATDTLIMSSQSQNAIIAIDPNDGSLKWIIKEPESVLTNSDKVLSVTGDDFIYTSGQHSVNVTTNPLYDDNNDQTIELTVFDNVFCVDSNGNNIVSNTGGYETTCADPDASSLLVYRVDTTNNTVEMIDSNQVDGYYSKIRSSWYQSPDFKYNYITYADMGQFVITDSDYNPLLTVQSAEQDSYYQNMYRARVFTNEQISDILKLENS